MTATPNAPRSERMRGVWFIGNRARWCARLRLREPFSAVRREPSGLLVDSVKEVIQPQVPLRLPCYDFAPVTTLAFGRLVP